MDELAHAAGQDPLEFRRKLMANHPKHLAVLNAAAEGIGWGKPAAKGVFRGLAQTMGFGSYVAGVRRGVGRRRGKLKIHRIVAATDPGHVVNPEQIGAAGRGLLRLRPLGGALRRDAPSRAAASSRRTSTPTT